jgi:hypothetical protein
MRLLTLLDMPVIAQLIGAKVDMATGGMKSGSHVSVTTEMNLRAVIIVDEKRRTLRSKVGTLI